MNNTDSQSRIEQPISSGSDLFKSLGENDFRGLQAYKTSNQYRKGQVVFKRGTPVLGLYHIDKGSVKISHVETGGRETILHLASEGETLAHSELVNNTNHTVTATALEDLAVTFISRNYISSLMSRSHAFKIELIKTMAHEIRNKELRLASMAQKNVREKMIELLLDLKKRRGIPEGNSWKIGLNISRKDIAKILGVAEETCIRFLSELRDEKIISQSGKTIFIEDLPRLENYA